MKKILILLLFSIFILNSCKKDSSNPLNSITGNTAPSAPTLASPTDTATNVGIPVTLKWNSTIGDTSYTLQVSVDSLFSSFVFNQSGLKDTSQQISSLSNATTYHWRVNTINNYGTSSWSRVWSFKTVVNSVTFTITQQTGTQGIIFYATPSAAVTMTNVNVSVPAAPFSANYTGDGVTVYPANQAFEINEFTGVQSGQKWVFVFTGKLGSATGTAFNVTSNYTVP
jgi:hypothetical protein